MAMMMNAYGGGVGYGGGAGYAGGGSGSGGGLLLLAALGLGAYLLLKDDGEETPAEQQPAAQQPAQPASPPAGSQRVLLASVPSPPPPPAKQKSVAECAKRDPPKWYDPKADTCRDADACNGVVQSGACVQLSDKKKEKFWSQRKPAPTVDATSLAFEFL